MRPADGEAPAAAEDREGIGFRRVGVDGREFDRTAVEFKFAGICGLELGVDGRELCDGRLLSI